MALTTDLQPTAAAPVVVADGLVGPVPADLEVVAARVERHLARMLEVERVRWCELDADLDEPLRCLERLVLSGGKRLRAAFAHWGFRATGADPVSGPLAPVLLDVAAALELLQAFALVHDDVMDGADSRRGAPTAHVTFAARHRDLGWRADPVRFGESVAILLGDLAHVWADALVAEAPPAARAVWRELSVEVMMGQYLDVLGGARATTTVAQARRIARLKSGRYTIERPLQLGAALAGGDAALLGVLSAYGAPLGEAFQLRDDVLGVVGDPARTGKPVGDDLREGKPTALLALARERATATEAAVLADVGRPDLDDDDIARLVEVLRATGALDRIERDIVELTTEATHAIAAAPLPPDVAVTLTDAAWFLATRER